MNTTATKIIAGWSDWAYEMKKKTDFWNLINRTTNMTDKKIAQIRIYLIDGRYVEATSQAQALTYFFKPNIRIATAKEVSELYRRGGTVESAIPVQTELADAGDEKPGWVKP